MSGREHTAGGAGGAGTSGAVDMDAMLGVRGVETRELVCFLALSEELHFGRAAKRLYVSQSRVSQMLVSLERRIGAQLLERTSRRVRLTPIGERFLAALRPAYTALWEAVEDACTAARGVEGVLRVGFQGMADEWIMGAIGAFKNRYPACEVAAVEIPLADPFGAVQGGEVDAMVVGLPVEEPDLVIGTVLWKQPQILAVSIEHPLASRPAVTAEELAGCCLIGLTGPAPRYWRETMAPSATPAGRPIPRGPLVCTLQEGLTAVATQRGTMLFGAPTATYHKRGDIAFVPVVGLPEPTLVLVWSRAKETERIRALNQAIAHQTAGDDVDVAPQPGART
ncbi:LysR family transcriptional regulator [Streptomyces zagrosensis]|uniref:DNA-binding transcriptional LysR family regulator n=1 Tax=Streptomyces zagrosensis TaxID=1042984 RepID=A0A7W9QIW4_9ACTN|nr:DNA-binding transcriptional LysR family regulator [Streptomyces zagrosensis]